MMVKKKEGKSGFMTFFVDIFKNFSLGLIQGIFDDFVEKIQAKVYETGRKVIAMLFSTVIFIVAVIFVAIAAVHLISLYALIPMGWSYLIVGLLLMLWAAIVAKQSGRCKNAS